MIATVAVTALLSGCGQATPPAPPERTPALAVSIVVEVELFDPEDPREAEESSVVADASADDPLPARPDLGDRNRTFFAFDDAAVREDQLATVREWGDWLKAHPDWALRIEGHTDRQGPCSYNRWLGQQRANTARDILLDEGVDASRLMTVSFGEERPAIPGASRAERSQNRRVRAEPMRQADLENYDPGLAPCALADTGRPGDRRDPALRDAPPN